MCRLPWNLGASTSWNPQGLSRPLIGLLYLLLILYRSFIKERRAFLEWGFHTPYQGQNFNFTRVNFRSRYGISLRVFSPYYNKVLLQMNGFRAPSQNICHKNGSSFIISVCPYGTTSLPTDRFLFATLCGNYYWKTHSHPVFRLKKEQGYTSISLLGFHGLF
jgi:hypothetical protein